MGYAQSPTMDLERAHKAILKAASALRKQLPPAYPANPLEAYAAAPNEGVRMGIVTRMAEGAAELLALAAVRELESRNAQLVAVEAARHLGPASFSWTQIGELVGITGQGAHRRFRARAERPRPELTIYDELKASQIAGADPSRSAGPVR